VELREFAFGILASDTLEGKLAAPEFLTDNAPGEPYLFNEPSRPHSLRFQKHSRKDRLPSTLHLHDADKRGTCLHRFCGHELLAVEIMAYAILAFPKAPTSFRKGVAHTLIEEQGHVRLYMERMKDMGITFGDYPLFKHFWAQVPYLITPAAYVSAMSLTFEQANLDFAPAYGKAFLEGGDSESSKLMQTIFEDEIRHVTFGSVWLRKLDPTANTLWESYLRNKPSNLGAWRGKGSPFQHEARLQAHLDQDWVTNILNVTKTQEMKS